MPSSTRLVPIAVTAVVLFATMFPSGDRGASAAVYDYLMCGWQVEPRTQSVAIDGDIWAAGVSLDDVLAGFDPWNRLFEKYHGFPIFALHSGNPEDADILITSRESAWTWVQNRCDPNYVQHGRTHSIIFVGYADAWRNRQVLAHELGHALGLADHGVAASHSPGHIGFRPCGSYIGVMSYCASFQTWFLDFEHWQPTLFLDGDLVASYW